jgi:DNA-binding transcriptional LysR family regulator
MLNNLDLYKIRLLSDLATTSSVSKTATNLNVTPSAVSQTLKHIEQQLGKQLFIRIGKTMKATPLTLNLCSRTIDYFDDLSEMIEADILSTQEIRVGAPPLFGINILTDFTCSYSNKNPRSKVLVSLKDTQLLIESLLQGKFDFVFLDETPLLNQFPEVVVTPCFKEELVLCASTKFCRDNKVPKKPSIHDLQRLPHVPYHKGKEGVHKWYLHHFKRVPDLNFKLSFDHPLSVLKAILSGCGLGVLPVSCLRDHMGEVLKIEGPRGPLINKVQIGQLKDKRPSAQEKQLIRSFLTDVQSDNTF